MSSKYGNIANMLGVELNEVFEVKMTGKLDATLQCYFTETGLKRENFQGDIGNEDEILLGLLLGKYKIIKKNT